MPSARAAEPPAGDTAAPDAAKTVDAADAADTGKPAADDATAANGGGITEIVAGVPGTGTVSVSLEFADLRAVVTALARAHNINLVGSDKLAGAVTLHLTDAPVLEALSIILKNAGFVLVKRENGMYEILTEAESVKADGASKIKIFTLKYAEVEQVAKLLTPNAVATADQIAQNPAANQLIIKGSDDELERAAQIIEAVDTPLPQVVIRTRIVEIFTDKAKSLGTELTLTGEASRISGGGVGTLAIDLTQDTMEATTFDATFLSDHVDAAINALTQKEVAEVLSAPRVTTGHGRPAEFRVVNQEPVITRTTRIVDTVTVTDETVTFKDTGVTLTVTPRVLADGQIDIIVEPAVLVLTGVTDTDPPVPIINERTAKTRVTISDGRWLVIGGLMSYRENEIERGVPLLKDIPVLGWLFKTKYTTREKSNLVFFVSATVLDDKRTRADSEAEQETFRTHREEHGLQGGPFPSNGDDGPPDPLSAIEPQGSTGPTMGASVAPVPVPKEGI